MNQATGSLVNSRFVHVLAQPGDGIQAACVGPGIERGDGPAAAIEAKHIGNQGTAANSGDTRSLFSGQFQHPIDTGHRLPQDLVGLQESAAVRRGLQSVAAARLGSGKRPASKVV
jgi:hypothetical protein